MQQPTLPSIPDNHVSILECGGNGDGLTMNTQAFAKAISKLNKMGGGHLNVPAGIYLTGLISLKDNIDLHLEKNAIIVLSEDKNDHFKIDETTGKKENRATPAINASKRKNISITGEGTIDGNGEWWRPVKRSKVSDVEWKEFQAMGGTLNEKGDIWYPFNLKHQPNVAENMDEQEKTRTHMIRFTSCENVLVQGVTLLNSPRFHLIPTRCKNVIIDGITVKCPWNAQNGDAIDISSCKDVLIVNNVIDAGDDGICMKGGAGAAGVAAGPCENINIQDNTVYHAHGGFVIGSEFSGGMKNIVVRNNTFQGTDAGLTIQECREERRNIREHLHRPYLYDRYHRRCHHLRDHLLGQPRGSQEADSPSKAGIPAKLPGHPHERHLRTWLQERHRSSRSRRYGSRHHHQELHTSSTTRKAQDIDDACKIQARKRTLRNFRKVNFLLKHSKSLLTQR